MSYSHGRQSTPSSALEVNTSGGLLTIGELARRAGVAASALRYYEEVGLLAPPARVCGQRRYPESAARLVAAIGLHSDAGFTIAEMKALLAPGASAPASRREIMRRKVAELDEQIARAQAAREAITHGLRCPHDDLTQCPNFNAGVTARLAGQPLSRSHRQLHASRPPGRPEPRRGRPAGLPGAGRAGIAGAGQAGVIPAACCGEPRPFGSYRGVDRGAERAAPLGQVEHRGGHPGNIRRPVAEPRG